MGAGKCALDRTGDFHRAGKPIAEPRNVAGAQGRRGVGPLTGGERRAGQFPFLEAVNEGARQRRNLRDALATTHSMTELAAQVNIGAGRLPTSSEQQARRFEKRCDDIALDGAYALYRMLSGMSHPSIDTIDAYLDGDTFPPGRALSVKSNPGVLGSGSSWAHMIACCLLWSGMVTNYLDHGRTRRNDLRRIARRLEVSPELAVRYTAHTRGSDRA